MKEADVFNNSGRYWLLVVAAPVTLSKMKSFSDPPQSPGTVKPVKNSIIIVIILLLLFTCISDSPHV